MKKTFCQTSYANAENWKHVFVHMKTMIKQFGINFISLFDILRGWHGYAEALSSWIFCLKHFLSETFSLCHSRQSATKCHWFLCTSTFLLFTIRCLVLRMHHLSQIKSFWVYISHSHHFWQWSVELQNDYRYQTFIRRYKYRFRKIISDSKHLLTVWKVTIHSYGPNHNALQLL